jgi:hypothetical protein
MCDRWDCWAQVSRSCIVWLSSCIDLLLLDRSCHELRWLHAHGSIECSRYAFLCNSIYSMFLVNVCGQRKAECSSSLLWYLGGCQSWDESRDWPRATYVVWRKVKCGCKPAGMDEKEEKKDFWLHSLFSLLGGCPCRFLFCVVFAVA